MTTITAFQPNAFQHNAFQIFDSAGDAGAAYDYWRKKHKKPKNLEEVYKVIVEELPQGDDELTQIVTPYTDEEEINPNVPPPVSTINFAALWEEEVARERFIAIAQSVMADINALKMHRARQREDEFILMTFLMEM